MRDAHAHVMQVKLCKANTRGVTSAILRNVASFMVFVVVPVVGSRPGSLFAWSLRGAEGHDPNRWGRGSLPSKEVGVKTGQESSRTNRHRFPYFLPVPVLVGKIRNLVGNRSKVTGTGTRSVLQFSRPFFRIPLVTQEFLDFPSFLLVSKLQTSTLALSPLYISPVFVVVNGWARWD